MTVAYKVTPNQREKFKEPFGSLIVGSFEETMAELKELVDSEKPPVIISVGDVVSRNLHGHKLHPQLAIIDGKFLRNQPSTSGLDKDVVRVVNPQGTITEEAIAAVKSALDHNQHTHILIEGEEDLLVITAVIYAPLGSFVVYGQPHTGIVVVKVSSQKKAEAQSFLNDMKSFEKLNKQKTV